MDDLGKLNMWHLIGIIVLLFAGATAHQLSGVDDGPVEEFIEDVLHVEGIDVDFSAVDKAKHESLISAGVATPTPAESHITPID